MVPRANEPARCLFRRRGWVILRESLSLAEGRVSSQREVQVHPSGVRVHDHERDRFSFLAK